MKKELLEYLVRHCVREVLSQVNEAGEDPTQGAPAPPEAGQGTAETPEIPKDKSTIPPDPTDPETPPLPELKGVLLVNPRDKSKLQKIPLKFTNDAQVERDLHNVGAVYAGTKLKVSISATRMVKDTIKNPHTTAYLYFGKYEPHSEEVFLMADKSIQVAKDSSVPPSDLGAVSISNTFNPASSGLSNYDQKAYRGGITPKYGVDETMAKLIKKMVNEVLDRK